MTAGPLPLADGHDAPGLIGEAVPRVAAAIDDGVVGCEHAVREPVVATRAGWPTPRYTTHAGEIMQAQALWA